MVVVVVALFVFVCVLVGFLSIERFSFESRKEISFDSATLHDWLEKLAPLFHPIIRKTKTNRYSLRLVFPRFTSATCNYFEF